MTIAPDLPTPAQTAWPEAMSATAAATPRPRHDFRALTGLTFLIQIVIVARHIALVIYGDTASFLVTGGYTVSLFFILSGFQLTLATPELTPRDCPRFFLKRLARIWPLQLVAILLAIFLLPAARADLTHPYGWFKLALHLTMTQTWIPDAHICNSFNPASWFLSALFFLYLLFPILRRRLERNWPAKLLAALALLVVIILLCDRHDSRPAADLARLNGSFVIYIHPLARLPEFLLGMILAVFFLRTRHRHRLGFLASTALEVLALTLIVLVKLALNSLAPTGAAGATYLHEIGGTILPYLLLVFILAAGHGPLARLLAAQPAVFLGRLGLAIFAVNIPIIKAAALANPTLPLRTFPFLLTCLLLWAIVLPAAFLLTSRIGDPCRLWLTRRFAPPAP